jgi:Cu(I)/Ag(I) efflux system membrane protein CusA/SilA
MVGGIFTSFLLELVVYPVVYELWKWNFELKTELGGSGEVSLVAEGALEAES